MQAAQDLHKFGPKYVLIKGGHLIATPSDPTSSTSNPQPAPSSPPSQPTRTASASQDSESTPVHEGDSASDTMQASNQAVSESNADGSLGSAGLQGQAQSPNSGKEAAAKSSAQHNCEYLHHLSWATNKTLCSCHPLTSTSAVEWLTGQLESLLQPKQCMAHAPLNDFHRGCAALFVMSTAGCMHMLQMILVCRLNV